MSGDPEQEYFADGITEDIITDCSKISGLFVIARNSTFTFKKQSVDIKDVGRKLGVRHVLEGSVRRAGMRVRINVQLIDAESGGHVWADRYDRDLEDIFLVQDEVTRKIVQTLEVTLTGSEKARRQDRGKVNSVPRGWSRPAPCWSAHWRSTRGWRRPMPSCPSSTARSTSTPGTAARRATWNARCRWRARRARPMRSNRLRTTRWRSR